LPKFLAIVLAIVTGLAAPAFAANAPPAAVQPAAKTESSKDAAKPEEKLICTREVPTGSTIPTRICRTKSQIEQDRRASEQIQSQNRTVGSSPIIPR
jgi:hypothetical protein